MSQRVAPRNTESLRGDRTARGGHSPGLRPPGQRLLAQAMGLMGLPGPGPTLRHLSDVSQPVRVRAVSEGRWAHLPGQAPHR